MNDSLKPNGAKETLPTALDVGLAKTRSAVDPAPDTTLTFACLREVKPLPKCALFAGSMVPTTPQTVDSVSCSIFLGSDEALVTEAELAKLNELQKRMTELHDEISEFSPANVGPYIFKKRDEIHAAVAGGTDPGDVTVPERSTVEHTFRIRRQGIIEKLKSITHSELVPVARPILTRFQKALEQSMRDIEQDQRANAQGFDLEYRPGLIWCAFAAVAARYTTRRLPESHAWALPSHVLEGLVSFE